MANNALPLRLPAPRALLAAVLVLALGVVGLAVFAGPAQSEVGPTEECGGEGVTVVQFPDAEFNDDADKIFSAYEPRSTAVDLAAVLPAGTYAVDAVSYDGYTARAEVTPQPFEQWVLEFLDADGNVLATTPQATADLEDGVLEATWAGPLGEVSWTGADAVAVRAQHASDSFETPNSVEPSCVGIEALDTDTPPEVLPDEVCPDGTTVANGEQCPVEPCADGTTVPNGEDCPVEPCADGTTVPNGEDCPEDEPEPEVLPETICPDGTTVEPGESCVEPPEVLPEVIEAPEALPTVLTPQFTG